MRRRPIRTRAMAVVFLATVLGVPSTPARADAGDTKLLGTVDVGSDARLSASVYDEHGQVVRHLYQLVPRSDLVTLRWDGKDDFGYDLPAGKYNWRATSSTITGTDDGGVGNRGKRVIDHNYDVTVHPGRVRNVAYGPDGSLYAAGEMEDVNLNSMRYAPADLPSGTQTWQRKSNTGRPGEPAYAAAADDQSAWFVVRTSDSMSLARNDVVTGEARHFDGSPWWEPTGRFAEITKFHDGDMPVTGLALQGDYVWVVDAQHEQVQVFAKSDGARANLFGGNNSFHITAPRGIAADGTGHLWIVTGDHAERFHYDGTSQTLRSDLATTTLQKPYGIALARTGASERLYISELGAGDVRVFDLAGGTPTPGPTWLRPAPAGGSVDDTTVGWQFDGESNVPGGNAAIAASPDGATLAVTDVRNGRTLFYDTASGAPRPYRLEGIAGPLPSVDPASSINTLYSQGREYRVDYDESDGDYGHPWQLVANWWPAGSIAQDISPSTATTRTLGNVRYEYVTVQGRCTAGTLHDSQNPPSACTGEPGPLPFGGVLIYRLNSNDNGTGMRREGMLRRFNYYATGMEFVGNTNDNDVLGDQGDTTWQIDDVEWRGDTTVTTEGALLIAAAAKGGQHGVLYVNPPAIQAKAPIYRPDGVAIKTTSVAEGGFVFPQELQAAYDTFSHRLYTASDTGDFDRAQNNGGTSVIMHDDATQQLSVFPGYLPSNGPRQQKQSAPDGFHGTQELRDTVIALDVDRTGPFYYTGQNPPGRQEVTMFSYDGMPLARAVTDQPTYGGHTGYFDFGNSLAAFTFGNTHYVYGQDNGYGRNTRYAFTGVESIRRFGSDPAAKITSGDFCWQTCTPPSGQTGWWRMDSGGWDTGYVLDSSAGNRAGRVGMRGNPPQVKQVRRWRTDEGRNGALLFGDGAADSVTFGPNFADGPADHLIDNGTNQRKLGLSAWIKTTGHGVIAGYQNAAIRGGKPTRSVPLMYIDDSGYLRAGANSSPACQAVSNGTVNDGQWHHVALSASEDVHDLYVDGTRTEATCGMSPLDGQLGWSAFGTGYTAIVGGYWPGTHQDVSPYEGFLDDVRLFARDLTDADVTSLRARPAASAFAHWDFGQASGKVLPDVTGHSKDGVVTGGKWRSSEHGGALEFDENTRVDLPLDVMQNQPITVSTWINPTKAGTILGNQRGAYPNKPGTGWYLTVSAFRSPCRRSSLTNREDHTAPSEALKPSAPRICATVTGTTSSSR